MNVTVLERASGVDASLEVNDLDHKMIKLSDVVVYDLGKEGRRVCFLPLPLAPTLGPFPWSSSVKCVCAQLTRP